MVESKEALIGIKDQFGPPDTTLIKMLIYCFCIGQWEKERNESCTKSF